MDTIASLSVVATQLQLSTNFIHMPIKAKYFKYKTNDTPNSLRCTLCLVNIRVPTEKLRETDLQWSLAE